MQTKILTHDVRFKAGLFDGIADKDGAAWVSIFGQPTLNAFMALRRCVVATLVCKIPLCLTAWVYL